MFAWSKDTTNGFVLKVDDLEFQKGKINLVVGPTGSGKTSMLLALLGMAYMAPNMFRRSRMAFVRRDVLYSNRFRVLVQPSS